MPEAILREAYSKVSRIGELSESRLKLVCRYKLDFEAMRAGMHGEAVEMAEVEPQPCRQRQV